jgi:hypothetical protein
METRIPPVDVKEPDMVSREFTISLPSDSKIEAINIKAGERKNYDTLVDVRVGPIVILEVSVIDDHVIQASAYLPSGIKVSDSSLEDAIRNAALSRHYGVDEASMREEGNSGS